MSHFRCGTWTCVWFSHHATLHTDGENHKADDNLLMRHANSRKIIAETQTNSTRPITWHDICIQTCSWLLLVRFYFHISFVVIHCYCGCWDTLWGPWWPHPILLKSTFIYFILNVNMIQIGVLRDPWGNPNRGPSGALYLGHLNRAPFRPLWAENPTRVLFGSW